MISKEEIQGLAELARLKLSEGEVASLQKDVSSILDYVGQIAAVPAHEQNTTPLHRNQTRADTPRTEADMLYGKEEALRAAFPKEERGYNVVRKIIQKDE